MAPGHFFKQAIDETTADVLVEGHGIFLPRLSADGSHVLYLSQTDPADRSVPISLMRLPISGGPPQLVFQDIAPGNYQCARVPSTLCIGSKLEKDGVVLFSFDPVGGIGRELGKLSGLLHNWVFLPMAERSSIFLMVTESTFFPLTMKGSKKTGRSHSINGRFLTATGMRMGVPF
jgi:hypothetical protein